nr:unnamed protein product [Spirometra erinaceieuropaei]
MTSLQSLPSEANNSSIEKKGLGRKNKESELKCLQQKIENLGHLGHPLIIEFLLLPSNYLLSKAPHPVAVKRMPAFLVEQWMVQLLPRRLVHDCLEDLSALKNEISAYCSSSVMNQLLLDPHSSEKSVRVDDVRCACRMTNLRGANFFSSCWFSVNADELSSEDEIKEASMASDYGALVRHSPPISIQNRSQTTMRTSMIKRNYVCNHSPYFHQRDIAGIFSTHKFTRISVGRSDVLDTAVTSILKLPSTLPPVVGSDNFLDEGTMSLPSKRSSETQEAVTSRLIPQVFPQSADAFSTNIPKSRSRKTATSTFSRMEQPKSSQVPAPPPPHYHHNPFLKQDTLSSQDPEPHHIIPKSPMVIMSEWNLSRLANTNHRKSYEGAASTALFKTSPLESPPHKQQRVTQLQLPTQESPDVGDGNRRVDECIAEFNTLNVKPCQYRCPLHHSSAKTSRTQRFVCTDESSPALPPSPSNLSNNVQDGSHLTSPRSPLGSRKLGAMHESSSSASLSRSFNLRTGLPLQSSPVPVKRNNSTSFDFDDSLVSYRPSVSLQTFTPQPKHVTAWASTDAAPDQLSPVSVPSLSTAAAAGAQVSAPSAAVSIIATTQSNLSVGPQYGKAQKRPNTLSLKGSTNERRTSKRSATTASDTNKFSCSAPAPSTYLCLSGAFHTPTSNEVLPSGGAVTTPQPITSQHLLINFEESMLNGRIPPSGVVDGFQLEIGASGSFYPAHLKLPVVAYFFHLSEDNAPSPYLGFVDLSNLPNKRGYHVPKKGSIQLALFNPSSSLLKVFVIQYDLEDMPANCQTFLRQRTVYVPVEKCLDDFPNDSGGNADSGSSCSISEKNAKTTSRRLQNLPVDPKAGLLFVSGSGTHESDGGSGPWSLSPPSTPPSSLSRSHLSSSNHQRGAPSVTFRLRTGMGGISTSEQREHQPQRDGGDLLPAYLRYLVHLRFHSTKSGNLYLHTDIRLIFARDKFEFDPRLATYEMRSFVDAPANPRYSPKK